MNKRVEFLLFRSNVEPMRVWLGIAAILWGILLLWPGNTFNGAEYTVMAEFANERIWGAAFLIQGVISIWSQLTDIKNRWLFVIDSVFGTMLWTVASLSMLLSVYPPPADSSATLAAALLNWWLMVRYQLPHTDSKKTAVKIHELT